MKEIITAKAPSAIGPYSQAVCDGNYIYVSGQLPINIKTGELISDVREAAGQILRNMGEILKEANSGLDHVMKITIFLTDLKEFDRVNEAYREFFEKPYPARSCVEVSGLPKGAKIEMECIAEINNIV